MSSETKIDLTAAVQKALETLSELMGKDTLKSDKIRLDAARAVLEYAAGVNHRPE